MKLTEEYIAIEPENGRTDTLIKTIEELEKVKKQLTIAVKGINEITDAVNLYFEKDGRSKEFTEDCLMGCGLSANQALHDIKELEK